MPPSEAQRLYDACLTPKPSWTQLGDVTRSVWEGYAQLKLAGVKDWWSVRHTNEGILSALSRASGVLRQFTTGETMELNHQQIAETLDEIAGLYLKLAGSFRPAASGGKGAAVAGKAAKKPVAKPPAEVEGDDDVTEDDVREKLKELAGAKGKDKMLEALESVGAAKLGDVDESQYQELIDKADELLAEEEAEPEPVKPKTRARKAKGPTLEQVNEAASALIEADKPAYLKIMKKLGKPSEMDASDYAAAIAAYEAAMPDDGDDNLL